MLSGIQLTLLIGPGIPVPAPSAVTNALTSAQVNVERERTGFQLTFSIGKESPLHTMIAAGYFDPIITRIILVATINGFPHVISDGMVTRQELSPSSDPGRSTFTITGEDLSILMDLVELPGMPYPAMPEYAIVSAVLARYAVLGIIPLVVPPISVYIPLPTERIPMQTGTDREYLRLLAGRSGYIFAVEPGPAPGVNIAYWGPDVRLPLPQPALSINFDAHTNVESLSMSLDGLAKRIAVVNILDPVTRKITIPVPIPNINVLRPPLGARLTPPSRIEFPEGLAKLDIAEAAARAISIVFGASDAVSASGSLDVVRYGSLLRSRQIVGVRGAGLAYDGNYYVESVTHNITHGEYKQNFTLSRDGLISLTPAVAP